MPHSCMDESGFGQVVMLRTLEGSSKDWGARQEGAATVDHVSPSGGGWPTTHGARGSPGPGTKAPCAAARGSGLAARVSGSDPPLLCCCALAEIKIAMSHCQWLLRRRRGRGRLLFSRFADGHRWGPASDGERDGDGHGWV